MRNFVICTAAVLGMVFVGTAQVEAGNRYVGHYSKYRYGNQNGHGFNRGHATYQNYNRYSWGSNYNATRYGGHSSLYRSTPVYHNTSNFDYHGPSLKRNGNHLDYVPAHYDYHRSGHYDF